MGSGSGLFSLLKDRGHLKVNREQLSHRCPRIAIEGKNSLGVRKHRLLTPEKGVGGGGLEVQPLEGWGF